MSGEVETVPAGGRSPGGAYLLFLLLAMGMVGFFDYFSTAFRFTMTTYVREEFSVSFGSLVGMSKWIFLGSCLSLLPRALADIHGRKVVLLFTLVVLCVAQWAVGFADTPVQYIALLTVLAVVYKSDIWLIIVSEEAPSRHRALFVSLAVGLGILGAYALGHLIRGMGEEQVAWREVSRFPIWGVLLALPLLLFLRETGHFRSARPGHPKHLARTLLAPFRRGTLRALVLLSLLKMIFVGGMFVTIILIGSEFLRTEHGFDPDLVGRVVQLEVMASIAGAFLAGFLSDRFGRHVTFYCLGALFAGSVAVLGLLPIGAAPVMAAYVAQSFAGTAINTILRVVTLEVLPTGCRSTGAAWTDVFTTLAAAGTATLIGWMTHDGAASIPLATILLVVSALTLPALPLYALVRETRGQDLERVA